MHARPQTLLVALALSSTVALAASACGSSSGTGGSSPEPTVTVTATGSAPTASSPSSPSSAASAPATSSPRVTQGADGTCGSSSLEVRYADDKGGAGAGSVTGTFTFTNTGDASCTLSGFPGVSYVAGSKGDQVGQPATRTGDPVATKTLEPGGSVTAALRRSQPGAYGSSCQETAVRGFRVYAPGDRGALFVPFATTGCKSTSAPLLQVGPVR